MQEWCQQTRNRLESLFLRGKITRDQYGDLSEYALSLALQVEASKFEWGVLDAEDLFSATLLAMEVL